jgi:hypothetical protein
MLVPVFALALLNAVLLIRYLERSTARRSSAWGMILFFILLFANPQSYASVKEDILAVVSLTCVLLIFHLWQSYLESGNRWRVVGIVALAIFASYVKETYFGTLLAFFGLQVLFAARHRKRAAALLAANLFIAALSLYINGKRGVFVDLKAAATAPYHQDWSPLSILHGYYQILQFLIVPAAAVLVMSALAFLALRDRRSFWIGLAALLLVATTVLPHALLPNHLEDQYAWLGAPFFLTPLLLAEPLLPRRPLPLAVSGLVALGFCTATLAEYSRSVNKGMAGWLREQEECERLLLSSWPILKKVTKPGERALVIGSTITFQPFSVPSFLRKSFGKVRWTVALPDGARKKKELTTQVIHESDVTSLNYDHVFVYNPDGALVGVHSRDEAAAIAQAGGFPQLPALAREGN